MKRLAFVFALLCATPPLADPPFTGTIWTGVDIIRTGDPSSFETITYVGQDARQMFDRRTNGWINDQPYLFRAVFSDGADIEVQVNSEYGSPELAEFEARRYMRAVGQLPPLLRTGVRTMWVHKGLADFGGGNDNLLVHQDRAAEYMARGNLEETLFHEAVHSSIDPEFADDPAWRAAQAADGAFISTYARDNPSREDLAESMLLAYALLVWPDRIPSDMQDQIRDIMPNRLMFFQEVFNNS